MKFLTSLLVMTLLSASVYAQLPTREEAVQIWQVSHPKSGSVATELRPGAATLEFPKGPIVSQRNIDLPPVKIQSEHPKGSWTRWAIDALITLKAKAVLTGGDKPSKRAGGSWKLFALLKDGRIVEARKNMYGTNLLSYQSDGKIEQHYLAQFALSTSISTQRDVEAKMATGASILILGNSQPGTRPLPWSDVTELWLIDMSSAPTTTVSAK